MRLFSFAFLACITTAAFAQTTTPETDNRAGQQGVSTANISAADAGDSKKESVQFDGEDLELASEEAQDGQKLREYIPAGETLDSWTKLASIREYQSDKSPAENVEVFEQVLKEKYPQSPCAITQGSKPDETLIDFVVWPEDGSFVEFNVFKYRRTGEKGIVAEQYALREYKDTEGFLKGLKPVRERLVKLMADEGLKINSNNANESN